MRVIPLKRREPPLFAHRQRMDAQTRAKKRAQEHAKYQEWLTEQVDRQPSLFGVLRYDPRPGLPASVSGTERIDPLTSFPSAMDPPWQDRRSETCSIRTEA
jgi:hypothetical protein